MKMNNLVIYFKKFISFIQLHKEFLFLLIPLVLITFFIFILTRTPHLKTNISTNNTTVSNFSNASKQIQQTLQVTSTSPANNATNVGLYPHIKIQFPQAVPQTAQKSFSLSLNPTTTGLDTWSSDEKTLTFTPSILHSSQNYIVTVSFNNKTYSWSFSTVSSDEVSTSDQQKEQTQADQNYGQWQQSVNNNYPWYNDLPIQTATYYVYFDLNSKSFIGILYPSTSSSTSLDNQVANIKSTITAQLTSLGIPYNNYPLNWEVTPAP